MKIFRRLAGFRWSNMICSMCMFAGMLAGLALLDGCAPSRQKALNALTEANQQIRKGDRGAALEFYRTAERRPEFSALAEAERLFLETDPTESYAQTRARMLKVIENLAAAEIPPELETRREVAVVRGYVLCGSMEDALVYFMEQLGVTPEAHVEDWRALLQGKTIDEILAIGDMTSWLQTYMHAIGYYKFPDSCEYAGIAKRLAALKGVKLNESQQFKAAMLEAGVAMIRGVGNHPLQVDTRRLEDAVPENYRNHPEYIALKTRLALYTRNAEKNQIALHNIFDGISYNHRKAVYMPDMPVEEMRRLAKKWPYWMIHLKRDAARASGDELTEAKCNLAMINRNLHNTALVERGITNETITLITVEKIRRLAGVNEALKELDKINEFNEYRLVKDLYHSIKFGAINNEECERFFKIIIDQNDFPGSASLQLLEMGELGQPALTDEQGKPATDNGKGKVFLNAEAWRRFLIHEIRENKYISFGDGRDPALPDWKSYGKRLPDSVKLFYINTGQIDTGDDKDYALLKAAGFFEGISQYSPVRDLINLKKNGIGGRQYITQNRIPSYFIGAMINYCNSGHFKDARSLLEYTRFDDYFIEEIAEDKLKDAFMKYRSGAWSEEWCRQYAKLVKKGLDETYPIYPDKTEIEVWPLRRVENAILFFMKRRAISAASRYYAILVSRADEFFKGDINNAFLSYASNYRVAQIGLCFDTSITRLPPVDDLAAKEIKFRKEFRKYYDRTWKQDPLGRILDWSMDLMQEERKNGTLSATTVQEWYRFMPMIPDVSPADATCFPEDTLWQKAQQILSDNPKSAWLQAAFAQISCHPAYKVNIESDGKVTTDSYPLKDEGGIDLPNTQERGGFYHALKALRKQPDNAFTQVVMIEVLLTNKRMKPLREALNSGELILAENEKYMLDDKVLGFLKSSLNKPLPHKIKTAKEQKQEMRELAKRYLLEFWNKDIINKFDKLFWRYYNDSPDDALSFYLSSDIPELIRNEITDAEILPLLSDSRLSNNERAVLLYSGRTFSTDASFKKQINRILDYFPDNPAVQSLASRQNNSIIRSKAAHNLLKCHPGNILLSYAEIPWLLDHGEIDKAVAAFDRARPDPSRDKTVIFSLRTKLLPFRDILAILAVDDAADALPQNLYLIAASTLNSNNYNVLPKEILDEFRPYKKSLAASLIIGLHVMHLKVNNAERKEAAERLISILKKHKDIYAYYYFIPEWRVLAQNLNNPELSAPEMNLDLWNEAFKRFPGRIFAEWIRCNTLLEDYMKNKVKTKDKDILPTIIEILRRFPNWRNPYQTAAKYSLWKNGSESAVPTIGLLFTQAAPYRGAYVEMYQKAIHYFISQKEYAAADALIRKTSNDNRWLLFTPLLPADRFLIQLYRDSLKEPGIKKLLNDFAPTILRNKYPNNKKINEAYLKHPNSTGLKMLRIASAFSEGAYNKVISLSDSLSASGIQIAELQLKDAMAKMNVKNRVADGLEEFYTLNSEGVEIAEPYIQIAEDAAFRYGRFVDLDKSGLQEISKEQALVPPPYPAWRFVWDFPAGITCWLPESFSPNGELRIPQDSKTGVNFWTVHGVTSKRKLPRFEWWGFPNVSEDPASKVFGMITGYINKNIGTRRIIVKKEAPADGGKLITEYSTVAGEIRKSLVFTFADVKVQRSFFGYFRYPAGGAPGMLATVRTWEDWAVPIFSGRCLQYWTNVLRKLDGKEGSGEPPIVPETGQVYKTGRELVASADDMMVFRWLDSGDEALEAHAEYLLAEKPWLLAEGLRHNDISVRRECARRIADMSSTGFKWPADIYLLSMKDEDPLVFQFAVKGAREHAKAVVDRMRDYFHYKKKRYTTEYNKVVDILHLHDDGLLDAPIGQTAAILDEKDARPLLVEMLKCGVDELIVEAIATVDMRRWGSCQEPIYKLLKHKLPSVRQVAAWTLKDFPFLTQPELVTAMLGTEPNKETRTEVVLTIGIHEQPDKALKILHAELDRQLAKLKKWVDENERRRSDGLPPKEFTPTESKERIDTNDLVSALRSAIFIAELRKETGTHVNDPALLKAAARRKDGIPGIATGQLMKRIWLNNWAKIITDPIEVPAGKKAGSDDPARYLPDRPCHYFEIRHPSLFARNIIQRVNDLPFPNIFVGNMIRQQTQLYPRMLVSRALGESIASLDEFFKKTGLDGDRPWAFCVWTSGMVPGATVRFCGALVIPVTDRNKVRKFLSGLHRDDTPANVFGYMGLNFWETAAMLPALKPIDLREEVMDELYPLPKVRPGRKLYGARIRFPYLFNDSVPGLYQVWYRVYDRFQQGGVEILSLDLPGHVLLLTNETAALELAEVSKGERASLADQKEFSDAREDADASDTEVFFYEEIHTQKLDMQHTIERMAPFELRRDFISNVKRRLLFTPGYKYGTAGFTPGEWYDHITIILDKHEKIPLMPLKSAAELQAPASIFPADIYFYCGFKLDPAGMPELITELAGNEKKSGLIRRSMAVLGKRLGEIPEGEVDVALLEAPPKSERHRYRRPMRWVLALKLKKEKTGEADAALETLAATAGWKKSAMADDKVKETPEDAGGKPGAAEGAETAQPATRNKDTQPIYVGDTVAIQRIGDFVVAAHSEDDLEDLRRGVRLVMKHGFSEDLIEAFSAKKLPLLVVHADPALEAGKILKEVPSDSENSAGLRASAGLIRIFERTSAQLSIAAGDRRKLMLEVSSRINREGGSSMSGLDFSKLVSGEGRAVNWLIINKLPVAAENLVESEWVLTVPGLTESPADLLQSGVERQKVLAEGPGFIRFRVGIGKGRPKNPPPFPVDDPSLHRFLVAGTQVNSDNPEIRRKALEVTKNTDNCYDAAAAILHWCYENLNYQITDDADAVDVLQKRAADCQEYSELMAAMCRSIGIPAKVVSGVAPGYDRFVAHAWVEIWAGEWIEMDPTWNREVVPACHVRMDVSSFVSLATHDLLRIKWLKIKTQKKSFKADEIVLKEIRKMTGSDEATGIKQQEDSKSGRDVKQKSSAKTRAVKDNATSANGDNSQEAAPAEKAEQPVAAPAN